MSDEKSLAFGPLEDRAAALAGGGLADRLSLRDHVVEVEIGAFEQERNLRQRLRFSVVVEIQPREVALDDDVDRILSYDRITEAIDEELAFVRFNLLETLAEGVAARILRQPQARRVFVRIEKLDRGPFALGVEIVRDRTAENVSEVEGGGPDISVACVPNGDQKTLEASLRRGRFGAPIVIVTGLPQEPRPKAVSEEGRLRVDLLAADQNAWVVASNLGKAAVAASRTELDWHLKNSACVIWAPSKMVLDATVQGPASLSEIDLAVWLAGEIGAARLLAHADVAIPAGCRVPVERI